MNRSTRIVLLSTLLGAAIAHAQVRMEISGANFRPLPVALPRAQTAGAVPPSAAASFDDALMLDASAAGIFQVLDRKSYLADPSEGVTAGTIQFPRWADVGAEALVKTQLSTEGDQLRGDLRLFTVAHRARGAEGQPLGAGGEPAVAGALLRRRAVQALHPRARSLPVAHRLREEERRSRARCGWRTGTVRTPGRSPAAG